MYTVYVLYSKSTNKIYIGFTSDIEQRLISHNHPGNKGWTRKFYPWILVYSEQFLKNTVRKFLWSLIKTSESG
jgi:putative endonuclease